MLFSLVLFGSLALIHCSSAEGEEHSGRGKTFRDCAGCPEMVVIPAGTFQMGDPIVDREAVIQDGPQRKVSVHALAVGKFDVTRGDWAVFVNATSRPTADGCAYSFLPQDKEAKASWKNLGFPQEDTHPVVCVTFRDAQDYVQWLSRRTGHKYRLPSEAEWEYVARAGTTTRFPWGSTASHEYVNYGGEDHSGYGVALGRDKWVGTSPVGSFPPNAFGLYDTNGNAMQWVEDCFSNFYAGAPTDGSAFKANVPVTGMTSYLSYMNGTDSCSYRLIRGGCYADSPGLIGSSSRNLAPAPGDTLETYRSSGLGIRVVRVLD